MSIPQKYDEEEIKIAIKDTPLWNNINSCLIREFVAENFPAAIGMINAIAIVSEKMEHHPDILLYGWNKLRIKLRTHEIDGLSELDFELAVLIDETLSI